MSVTHECDEGWVVSHENFLTKCYAEADFVPKNEMFLINTPYMKDDQARKKYQSFDLKFQPFKRLKLDKSHETVAPVMLQQSDQCLEVDQIKKNCDQVLGKIRTSGEFQYQPQPEDFLDNNSLPREFSNAVFKMSKLNGSMMIIVGRNESDKPVRKKVHGENYLFPPRCAYFCGDVFQINHEVLGLSGFNLAVIDPPWWNKYIRRRKLANKSSSYDMLSNEKLSSIPLKNLLAADALVAVWCTNSPSNIKDLKDLLFPAWGLKFVATWFWVKVDRSGSTVCQFSKPPGKQPFERIIFGRFSPEVATAALKNPEDGKILLSVPSAIHSHKPPLRDLLLPYVESKPKTLELFARSLMPDTTSCGFEVLKLQHDFLFQQVEPKGKEMKHIYHLKPSLLRTSVGERESSKVTLARKLLDWPL